MIESIKGLFNYQRPTELYDNKKGRAFLNINNIFGSVRGFDLANRTNASSNSTSSSFGAQVVEATPSQRVVDVGPNHKMIIHDPISVRLPGENCIYSGGDGSGQSAYIEYTDYSTENDPVVRIMGKSLSGEYDQIVHINDIDPSNATYPELCALFRHLHKTGQADTYQLTGIVDRPIPFEVERGDYSERQNFIQKIEACISKNQRYNPDVAQDGRHLLTVYEKIASAQADKANPSTGLSGEEYLKLYKDYIEKNRVEAEKAAEHEALIKAVDNVIEGKAPMEPQEILERLSEPAKDTLEDIKDDKEVSHEQWQGLLGELRDMGAISKEQFDYSRSDVKLIPLGYKNASGEFVMYDGIAERFGMLDKLRSTSGGGIGILTDTADAWSGDPLDFLDAWIENLTEWRGDLSRQRSETGALKYDDFSPLDKQIDACTKVGELINSLLTSIGTNK